MSTREYPSIDYVKSLLRYEDGRLYWLPRPRSHFLNDRTWKKWHTQYAGKEAGHLRKSKLNPRCTIRIDGELFFRHLIVWAIHHGEWREWVDHRNRDKSDDRIENLRPVTRSQNRANCSVALNNISGLKGAHYQKTRGRWTSSIKVGGKQKHLGCFDTAEEAHAAYVKAAREYFGDFACEE